jgi:hypothetical protein
LNLARNYIRNLQKYENAPEIITEIKDEFETEEFLKIWFTDEKLKNFNIKRISDILPEYNNWFKEVNFNIKILGGYYFERKRKEN